MTMTRTYLWFPVLFIFSLMSCDNTSEQSTQTTFPDFDVEGHRGARGHYPENTVDGFLLAVDMGVNTLEMDAVMTKDGEIILSHEPWMSHIICQSAAGDNLSSDIQAHNIYKMTLEEVQSYDCGSLPHPDFPDQQKVAATKPRLADVIEAVEGKIRGEEGADIWYNIETKTDPRGDNMFHPAPEPFVDALVSIIEEKGIAARAVIQSFDLRTLQVAHTKYPDIKLALLVGDTTAPAVYLDSLGFTPYIYSCRYTLLEKQDIVNLQRQGMKVIPWTVNQPADIQRLMDWGVDGIISDYPDRVIAVQKQKTGGS